MVNVKEENENATPPTTEDKGKSSTENEKPQEEVTVKGKFTSPFPSSHIPFLVTSISCFLICALLQMERKRGHQPRKRKQMEGVGLLKSPRI